MRNKFNISGLALICLWIIISVQVTAFSGKLTRTDKKITYETDNARLEIYNNMDVRLYSWDRDKKQEELLASASPFSMIISGKDTLRDYEIIKGSASLNSSVTNYGHSDILKVSFRDNTSRLTETISFIMPDNLPETFICTTVIRNTYGKNIEAEGILQAAFTIDGKNYGADSSYKFWSFQGGSYPERFDWILPLNSHYARENYQGMNAPDYGGGIPVVDLWTKEKGFAIAYVSARAKDLSLPVNVSENGKVNISIKDNHSFVLKPGDTITLDTVAVILHKGDFYNALKRYSSLIKKLGINMPESPASAFQSEWCAWGYERNFNKKQILSTLNKVKDLGIEWVTIDDGWQNADGDWGIDKSKFPGGEKEFKQLIDSIHSRGLKARLWWVPFDAHDSAYNVKTFPARMNEYGMKFQSSIAQKHPEWFILNKDGSRSQISWWNSYLFCPAVDEVKEYYRNFITRAITGWGIDGFKIDGQHLNMVPPCYNPAHKHSSPYDAPRAVADFFREIEEAARKSDQEFVVQLCPCGTNFSLYNLPYMNQAVASDPLSSFQVRLKGKTFKAIAGDQLAYSGDHVELTNRKWNDSLQKFTAEGMEDFASTIAIGGVPSTKFTMPGLEQSDSSLILTKEKEAYWKKWLMLYSENMLSRGNYINLYDIAFDKPETHLIEKDGVYYYSFFSDKPFSGRVELRGLTGESYIVTDIINNKEIARINKNDPFIDISFDSSLILKVTESKALKVKTNNN